MTNGAVADADAVSADNKAGVTSIEHLVREQLQDAGLTDLLRLCAQPTIGPSRLTSQAGPTVGPWILARTAELRPTLQVFPRVLNKAQSVDTPLMFGQSHSAAARLIDRKRSINRSLQWWDDQLIRPPDEALELPALKKHLETVRDAVGLAKRAELWPAEVLTNWLEPSAWEAQEHEARTHEEAIAEWDLEMGKDADSMAICGNAANALAMLVAKCVLHVDGKVNSLAAESTEIAILAYVNRLLGPSSERTRCEIAAGANDAHAMTFRAVVEKLLEEDSTLKTQCESLGIPAKGKSQHDVLSRWIAIGWLVACRKLHNLPIQSWLANEHSGQARANRYLQGAWPTWSKITTRALPALAQCDDLGALIATMDHSDRGRCEWVLASKALCVFASTALVGSSTPDDPVDSTQDDAVRTEPRIRKNSTSEFPAIRFHILELWARAWGMSRAGIASSQDISDWLGAPPNGQPKIEMEFPKVSPVLSSACDPWGPGLLGHLLGLPFAQRVVEAGKKLNLEESSRGLLVPLLCVPYAAKPWSGRGSGKWFTRPISPEAVRWVLHTRAWLDPEFCKQVLEPVREYWLKRS